MNTPTPHLEHLNPALLTTDQNVRADLRLDKPFLASIKQNGVLEPIVAYPDPDAAGSYRVHIGHRRHAAAVEVGLEQILVVIVPEPSAESRIVEQLVENHHRNALTPVETAKAFQQLQLAGMPAIQIAKRTSTKIAHVGDAIKTIENPDAAKLLQEHQVDLTQAALIAEFADDAKLTEQLLTTAAEEPGQLEHEAQRARDDRAGKQHLENLKTEAKKAKLTLVARPQNFQGGNKHQVLEDLVEKKTGAPVDAIMHAACPGHGAYVGEIGRYVKNSYVAETRIWLLCTDPAKYGHRHVNSAAPTVLTDEERARRAKEREDKANWVAASAVRDTWIKDVLLAQKPGAVGGGQVIDWLIGAGNTVLIFKPSMGTHKDLAARWLGATTPAYNERDPLCGYDSLAYWLTANPTKGLLLALAVALAGMEDVITNTKGDTKAWSDDRGKIGPYLERLRSCGYSLSPIELTIVQNDRDRAAKASK